MCRVQRNESKPSIWVPAAVLPPERQALVEIGLVQQIHEQGRVFLVRDVVGDRLNVLRHPHRLANRLEVRVADASQGFIMLVDRRLDAACFIHAKKPFRSRICSGSRS